MAVRSQSLYRFLRWMWNTLAFGRARIRARMWGMFFHRVGRHTTIMTGFSCRDPQGIALGDHVNINERCTLDGNGGLEIGDYVWLAQNVTILTAAHHFGRRDILLREQGNWNGRVTIGRDSWLGVNVVVLPGVTIGEGAVVGAGSIVTHDVPPYAVVAGVPARVLRYRT